MNRPTYPSTIHGILKGLCCDSLLVLGFQKQHKCVKIEYGGGRSELTIKDKDSIRVFSVAFLNKLTLFPRVRTLTVNQLKKNLGSLIWRIEIL